VIVCSIIRAEVAEAAGTADDDRDEEEEDEVPLSSALPLMVMRRLLHI
jgi:hypothetical protein